MITVLLPAKVVHLIGGTSEEQQLHRTALEQYLGHDVQFHGAPPAGERWGYFHDALAQMNAAHAPLAEDMCRGMDSMAGLL